MGVGQPPPLRTNIPGHKPLAWFYKESHLNANFYKIILNGTLHQCEACALATRYSELAVVMDVEVAFLNGDLDEIIYVE